MIILSIVLSRIILLGSGLGLRFVSLGFRSGERENLIQYGFSVRMAEYDALRLFFCRLWRSGFFRYLYRSRIFRQSGFFFRFKFRHNRRQQRFLHRALCYRRSFHGRDFRYRRDRLRLFRNHHFLVILGRSDSARYLFLFLDTDSFLTFRLLFLLFLVSRSSH